MLKYNNLLRTALRSQNFRRCFQKEALNIEKLEEESTQVDGKNIVKFVIFVINSYRLLLVFDEEQRLKEEYIEKKRNKSRLLPQHRNILFDKVPYEEPKFWTHGTLKYKRQMYGTYGESSKVNPSLCWPIKEELEDRKLYESLAHTYTISEMISKASTERQEKKAAIRARDLEIQEKMKKLDGWIKEMKHKQEKKESETLLAKQRKEKLIEEVRRYFGYTVDPRDEKFKEMLEKKEKEQKKAMKEARKKAKEAKLLEKLSNKQPEDTEKKSNEQ